MALTFLGFDMRPHREIWSLPGAVRLRLASLPTGWEGVPGWEMCCIASTDPGFGMSRGTRGQLRA